MPLRILIYTTALLPIYYSSLLNAAISRRIKNFRKIIVRSFANVSLSPICRQLPFLLFDELVSILVKFRHDLQHLLEGELLKIVHRNNQLSL